MPVDDADGSPPPVPWWIRVVDAGALLLLAVLAWKILTADVRAGAFGLIPRVRSQFLLYAIAAMLAVRHIALPRPTAIARLRHLWGRLADAPDWGPAVRAFLGTRLMVFLVAFFAVVTFGLNKPGFVLTSDPLTNLPARFDAGWYGGIALHGYDRNVNFERQRNIAFFPALPLLMRPVGLVFGTGERGMPLERRMARVLWAGVFISLCAFLLALLYLVKLGTQVFGPERAASAALLLASYPFACFFNAPYTESLFLLGVVATAHHFMRSEWVLAGAWGLLAGLTRPNGFFLSVPLGLLALQQFRPSASQAAPGAATVVVQPFRAATSAGNQREALKALAAAAMPVAGMLAFTVYLYSITGTWFAWSRSHAAWGRRYNGFAPLARGYGWLRDEGIIQVATNIPFDILNTLAAAFALLMIWPVARRLGIAWAIYVVIMVVPPIFAGGALSLARMTSTLFPLFLTLAAILPPRAVPSWAAAFAILQGLCAALFFTWRELF